MNTHAAIILGAWIYVAATAHRKDVPPFWGMFVFALALFISMALR